MQDLKLEMDQLTREEATARFPAAVVGKAHARQMEPATYGKWSETISHKSKNHLFPGFDLQVVLDAECAGHTRLDIDNIAIELIRHDAFEPDVSVLYDDGEIEGTAENP